MNTCMQWDREFDRSACEIGYYDRLLEKIIRIPFTKIICPHNVRKTVQVMDCEGEIHFIPLHRIREVYKDGRLIWQL